MPNASSGEMETTFDGRNGAYWILNNQHWDHGYKQYFMLRRIPIVAKQVKLFGEPAVLFVQNLDQQHDLESAQLVHHLLETRMMRSANGRCW